MRFEFGRRPRRALVFMKNEGYLRGVPRRPPNVVLPLVILAASCLPMLIVSESSSLAATRVSIQFLSVLTLILGLWIFWIHGGRRITAAGTWGLCAAVLIGLGGLFELRAYTDWTSIRLPEAMWIS